MKIVIDDKIPYIREAIASLTADAVYKKGAEIVESLKAVEPTGGEPEAVLALRDDVVKPSADKDELLANCAERTFFAPVVPKVVE